MVTSFQCPENIIAIFDGIEYRRPRRDERLDLDEVDSIAQRLSIFSHNRGNVLSFHDRDHGAGIASTLRPQIEAHLHAGGHSDAGHRIKLLCMPRVFGYSFNPLSIYFCYGANGALSALVYEVSNTFGERHSYLIPHKASPDPIVRQRCEKQFYVSPFLDMEMSYDFRLTEPKEALAVSVLGSNADGAIIFASMKANRYPLSNTSLLHAVCTHPLLTQKVISAIHWEALRLWMKGSTFHARPSAPNRPVTTVCPHTRALRKEEYV